MFKHNIIDQKARAKRATKAKATLPNLVRALDEVKSLVPTWRVIV
jgi:hypothetical protein